MRWSDGHLLGETSRGFMMSYNPFGMAFGFAVHMLQIYLFIYFIQISDGDHENTAYVSATPSCFDTDGERVEEPICTDEYETSNQAIIISNSIILMTVAPSGLMGILMMLSAFKPCLSPRWLVVGFLIVVESLLALAAGVIYISATAQDDSTAYLNCVAVLFVHDLDGAAYNTFRVLFGTWTENMNDTIDCAVYRNTKANVEPQSSVDSKKSM